jgi:pimeloyl-ACP methyl ester carboxylesterase
MHFEALSVLPEIRTKLNLQDVVLVGHSDGASIALIHAARHSVRGVAVMAPHVFIEQICIDSIVNAVKSFETTDLPERLGRYHRDVRKTFYGWADVWLDPEFVRWDIRNDFLPQITSPLLAIQGYDDEYGTMAQLDEIASRVRGPSELVPLENCGHSPFRDQPDRTLSAIQSFVRKLIFER